MGSLSVDPCRPCPSRILQRLQSLNVFSADIQETLSQASCPTMPYVILGLQKLWDNTEVLLLFWDECVVSVCTHASMEWFTATHVPTEGIRKHQMSCSEIPHLSPLKKGFLLNLELGQWWTNISLSPISYSAKITSMCMATYVFPWVLGLRLRSSNITG